MRKKILSNSKKGSLSLSMNAIVTVVLAFAMLGLGLAITTMIFDSIEPPSIPKIGQDANAANPIALPDVITVKRGTTAELAFDYYNRGDSTAANAKPYVSECIDEDDNIVGIALLDASGKNVLYDPLTTVLLENQFVKEGKVYKQLVPSYAVPISDVDPGSDHEFVGLFSLKSDEIKDAYSGGETYICSLIIHNSKDSTVDDYESDSFYLTITT